MARFQVKGVLIAVLCLLLSSCAFGRKDHWTLEEEQQEKALMEEMNTAPPEQREAIQRQMDELRDNYKYHLDWPEEQSPPPLALSAEEEKAKAVDHAIDSEIEEFNGQSGK